MTHCKVFLVFALQYVSFMSVSSLMYLTFANKPIADAH